MKQLKRERDLLTDVQYAQAAKMMIENPLFEGFFRSIEYEAYQKLMTLEVSPETQKERDAILLEMQACRALYKKISDVINEGKMSETKLARIRNDAENGRTNPRMEK